MEGIVLPLIAYLQRPLEDLDMQRVVDLISHDNSLAAQCLHLANSPLFGRWQTITTTRGAVIALGLQRMREIAMSCCVLKLIPRGTDEINPLVLWEHSLGCALLCRRIAKRTGMSDPEQAYLSGLLHDLGFVVNLRLLNEEFQSLMKAAASLQCSMEKVEQEQLGFTHCDSGRILARKWNLSPAIIEVISHHHRFSALDDNRPLIALVNLSDRLCRLHGLGYGYIESITVEWERDEAIEILRETSASAKLIDWPRFSCELDAYLKDVKKLVSVLYRFDAG